MSEIIYSSVQSDLIEVIAVRPLDDMMMLVTFNTQEVRLYDATQLLCQPAFTKLADEAVFKSATVDTGAIVWDNGNIDIAPETVYVNSLPYNQEDIITA